METSVEMRIQDVRDMLTEKTNKILKGCEEDKARARIKLRELHTKGKCFWGQVFEEDLAWYHSKIDEDIKKALDEVSFMESLCNASGNGMIRISKEDFRWLTC